MLGCLPNSSIERSAIALEKKFKFATTSNRTSWHFLTSEQMMKTTDIYEKYASNDNCFRNYTCVTCVRFEVTQRRHYPGCCEVEDVLQSNEDQRCSRKKLQWCHLGAGCSVYSRSSSGLAMCFVQKDEIDIQAAGCSVAAAPTQSNPPMFSSQSCFLLLCNCHSLCSEIQWAHGR